MTFESEVAARKAMVRATHPLMRKREEVPDPAMIPFSQALAMELEMKEDLEARLIKVKANIKSLRDCA
jgi:hypothetical protein